MSIWYEKDEREAAGSAISEVTHVDLSHDAEGIRRAAKVLAYMAGACTGNDSDDKISRHNVRFDINHPDNPGSEIVHKCFLDALLSGLDCQFPPQDYSRDSLIELYNVGSVVLTQQVIVVEDVPGASSVWYTATRPAQAAQA